MSVTDNTVVHYRMDASRSRFVVQAFADGLFSMFGHNPTIAICGFGGDARFVLDTLEKASLLMLVTADSFTVTDKVSDKDRSEIERAMREDVLEIARYPEIVFMSTKTSAHPIAEGQHHVKITGDLTLHGVTREHLIDANVTVNQDSLSAQGEFSLRQTDYNIKPVSIAGGTLKVKDDLKFSFDIAAERQG
ncbi:MAG: YceI family protein [Acidobacteriota bacterium]|nr:YceI family protein [Acidobacteriota bacterium]